MSEQLDVMRELVDAIRENTEALRGGGGSQNAVGGGGGGGKGGGPGGPGGGGGSLATAALSRFGVAGGLAGLAASAATAVGQQGFTPGGGFSLAQGVSGAAEGAMSALGSVPIFGASQGFDKRGRVMDAQSAAMAPFSEAAAYGDIDPANLTAETRRSMQEAAVFSGSMESRRFEMERAMKGELQGGRALMQRDAITSSGEPGAVAEAVDSGITAITELLTQIRDGLGGVR